MEIREMTIADIEAREAEMKAQIESAESEEQLNEMKESFTEERKLLSERKAELKDLEERKAKAEELNKGAMPETILEERKEETKMDVKELRNSQEYINAYANYLKTGKDDECRALLTTNATVDTGYVAVPDFVYDKIMTAWEKSDVMSLVRKINAKGNMKVQFELSTQDAVIHLEGSGAISEEALTLGTVTLVPESIKKMVRVSDEVLSMKSQDFLDYVVDEISYKIVKKAESVLINKIKTLSTSASSTAVYAKQVKAGAAVGTIAKALGQLSDEATNPVIVMNKATWSAFKAAQYANGFSVDPFEGLKVVFTSALPALADASENNVYAIVGDFGLGALANFPDGQLVDIKIDDKTEMDSDIVRILGREFVAVEPVCCGAFVNITAPAAG